MSPINVYVRICYLHHNCMSFGIYWYSTIMTLISKISDFIDRLSYTHHP